MSTRTSSLHTVHAMDNTGRPFVIAEVSQGDLRHWLIADRDSQTRPEEMAVLEQSRALIEPCSAGRSDTVPSNASPSSRTPWIRFDDPQKMQRWLQEAADIPRSAVAAMDAGSLRGAEEFSFSPEDLEKTNPIWRVHIARGADRHPQRPQGSSSGDYAVGSLQAGLSAMQSWRPAGVARSVSLGSQRLYHAPYAQKIAAGFGQEETSAFLPDFQDMDGARVIHEELSRPDTTPYQKVAAAIEVAQGLVDPKSRQARELGAFLSGFCKTMDGRDTRAPIPSAAAYRLRKISQGVPAKRTRAAMFDLSDQLPIERHQQRDTSHRPGPRDTERE